MATTKTDKEKLRKALEEVVYDPAFDIVTQVSGMTKEDYISHQLSGKVIEKIEEKVLSIGYLTLVLDKIKYFITTTESIGRDTTQWKNSLKDLRKRIRHLIKEANSV